MTAALALVTLLLTPAAAAQRAAAPPCQIFTRASPAAPQLVREWLAQSNDERVRVCPQTGSHVELDGAPPLYFGESALSRHGTVCSYRSHGLAVVGSGAASRLRTYERSEALAMALVSGDCPVPQASAAASAYVMTYDTSRAAFSAIMELWRAVATSPAAFDHELACCDLGKVQPGAVSGAAEAAQIRSRLRTTIEAGHMRAAAVTRIVRIPGSLLRHRYVLFVTDPDRPAAQPGFYVVYLQKELRGPGHIIGIADGN